MCCFCSLSSALTRLCGKMCQTASRHLSTHVMSLWPKMRVSMAVLCSVCRQRDMGWPQNQSKPVADMVRNQNLPCKQDSAHCLLLYMSWAFRFALYQVSLSAIRLCVGVCVPVTFCLLLFITAYTQPGGYIYLVYFFFMNPDHSGHFKPDVLAVGHSCSV